MAKNNVKEFIVGVSQVKAKTDFRRKVNSLSSASIITKTESGDADQMRVFEFQFFKHCAGQCSISMTPFCIEEVRIVVSGSEHIIGVKVDSIPGSTLKEKTRVLYEKTVEELAAMAKRTGGFAMTLTSSSGLFVVPRSHLIINIKAEAGEGVCGVRWGFVLGPEQAPDYTNAFDMLTSSYPETNSIIMQWARVSFDAAVEE